MELKQVSDHCYAALNEANRVCDANSGLVNLGEGLVIDTQSDLAHARDMIELFSEVWPGMPAPSPSPTRTSTTSPATSTSRVPTSWPTSRCRRR